MEEMATDNLQQYLKEIGQYPRLDRERTRYLVSRKDFDPAAREELINCNLRLVVYVVKYTNRKGMDFMDLVMAGNESLIHGIDLFKGEFNTELSTYVVPWIKQAVHRAIANQSRTIRIPLETSNLIDKLHIYISSYRRDHGTDPSDEDCARQLGISVKKVKNLKDWSRPVVSIDTTLTGNDEKDGKSLSDMISSPDGSTAPGTEPGIDTISQLIEHEALLDALAVLTPREKLVIARRFGFGSTDIWTLDQVADELCITKEAVRQIQLRALKKLKEAIEEDPSDHKH
ncbi:MAG: sigma-70 family RNA polymerase sigma factor [Lachnospiraceae bacterium]|nr:sigma-70 family RNA polymerase sigma factor [Lachnospiraceae bacterium]